MFEPSVLVAAFVAQWNVSPNLILLVPGGIHYRRFRGETVVRPYALIDVVPTAKEADSSLHAIQESIVTIRAVIDDHMGNATIVSQAMHDALDYCNKSLVIPSGYCMHVNPVTPEDMGISPDEKLGQNVIEVTAAWAVMIYSR